MKLRWYVKKYRYSTWDTRSDSWFHHTATSEQKLQYHENGKWKDVPMFDDVTDERIDDEDH